MTIPEIKSRLSIDVVLAHYGLQPKGQNLTCPFHDDKKASMRVYPETNTVYCFAGSCAVEHLDMIDFIMRMDKSTKRAAILKAKSLCGEVIRPKSDSTELLDAGQLYADSLETMRKNPSGRAYCELRGLDSDQLGIGYRTRKSAEKWGRGCIIFPLLNAYGEVVSLYGRAVKGSGHYYTAGREGLYPSYPASETKRLLLTESVIDAASLHYLEGWTVLALYGTNGLTDEHQKVVTALKQLEEITLLLDGDLAGRMATQKIGASLAKLRPNVKISIISLAEGEDVNGMFASEAAASVMLKGLLNNRQPLGQLAEKSERKADHPISKHGLTSHAHYLEYLGGAATYRIRGGIRGGADSLKVSLQIQWNGQDYRAKVDLYEYKQSHQLAERVAELLQLRKDLVVADLTELTGLLETERESDKPSESPKTCQRKLGAGEKAAVLSFLRRKDLLTQISDYLGRAGIVGEQKSRLLLYLVALSQQSPAPLHALVQGSSGSGKTHLITKIAELLPTEEVIVLTRVTDSSFYNYGRDDLRHKLIVLEDLDGLKEEALLAFRELQSRGKLSSSTSIKDQAGNIKGMVRTVYGPIASLAATTKGEVYEDNLSRCLVIAVDESDTQTKAVIGYQNRKAAGLIDTEEEDLLKGFLRSCARLLDRSKEVVNPYATQVQLPTEASKLRRLNALYQSFVRQVVLLHQYQRKTDRRGRLIAEVSDLKAACEILFDSIVLKVDELDGALRYFYERLKDYVLSRGQEYEFTRREVRQALRISKTQQHTYLTQLLELEYIRQVGGYANRGLTYKIAYWDNAQAVREHLKSDLNAQLDKINSKTERHGTPERTPATA